MEKYKVRSKYKKGSKKPYIREIKRLDSLSDRFEHTNNSNGLKPCPCGKKKVYLKKEPL